MTVIAISDAIMVPPTVFNASGVNAKIVVNAVIKIGRKRVRPPCTNASKTDLFWSRS